MDLRQRLETGVQIRQFARAHPLNDFGHNWVRSAEVGNGSFHLKDNHNEMRRFLTTYLAAIATAATLAFGTTAACRSRAARSGDQG